MQSGCSGGVQAWKVFFFSFSSFGNRCVAKSGSVVIVGRRAEWVPSGPSFPKGPGNVPPLGGSSRWILATARGFAHEALLPPQE